MDFQIILPIAVPFITNIIFVIAAYVLINIIIDEIKENVSKQLEPIPTRSEVIDIIKSEIGKHNTQKEIAYNLTLIRRPQSPYLDLTFHGRNKQKTVELPLGLLSGNPVFLVDDFNKLAEQHGFILLSSTLKEFLDNELPKFT